jgi:hypothetical protein
MRTSKFPFSIFAKNPYVHIAMDLENFVALKSGMRQLAPILWIFFAFSLFGCSAFFIINAEALQSCFALFCFYVSAFLFTLTYVVFYYLYYWKILYESRIYLAFYMPQMLLFAIGMPLGCAAIALDKVSPQIVNQSCLTYLAAFALLTLFFIRRRRAACEKDEFTNKLRKNGYRFNVDLVDVATLKNRQKLEELKRKRGLIAAILFRALVLSRIIIFGIVFLWGITTLRTSKLGAEVLAYSVYSLAAFSLVWFATWLSIEFAEAYVVYTLIKKTEPEDNVVVYNGVWRGDETADRAT